MQSHEYGPYIALYLYSGLRPGEGFGLMWNDIDRKNMVFHIQRSLTLVEVVDEQTGKARNTYQITPGTKTDEERVVAYNAALEVLLDRIPQHGLFVMSREIKSKNDLGDTITTYSHHTHSSFDALYYKFFDDLNRILAPELIPRLTPHKMRHTFATYLRKAGANLDEIRELLGHKSISTTMIYDTVDIEDKRSTVSKLPY